MFKTITAIFIMFSTMAQDYTRPSINRFFIAEKMNLLFGESANNEIRKNVLERVDVFGGYCFLNDQMKKGLMNSDCTGRITESKVANYSKTTNLKKSLMREMCNKVINNKVAFQHFKKLLPKFNIIEIRKAFIGYNDLERTQVEKLQEDSTINSESGLKSFTLYTCLDPRWYEL